MDQLGGLIIPLIGIALILVIGFLIIAQLKSQVLTTTGVSHTYNESIAGWVTGTYYTSISNMSNCMSFSCEAVYNGSGSAGAISAGNTIVTSLYNCSYGRGLQISNGTTDLQLNNTLYLLYTCTPTTTAWNATSTVQNATQDIPGWLPIIIITIIGSLLIGLIAMFRKTT